MGSSFSGLLELPWRTDRAMGTEWSCPICHDEQEGVAYVIPCGHEFCMGCILRWAEKKPECPLCRRLIESVRFSLQEQKYLECVITPQGESPETSSQVGSSAGSSRQKDLFASWMGTAASALQLLLNLLCKGHSPQLSRGLQGPHGGWQ